MFDILVVDDDKNTRFMLRELLESENYTVTEATNGEEALRVFEKNHRSDRLWVFR